MMGQTERQSMEQQHKNLLYNAWLWALANILVVVALLVLKYHRIPYGGSPEGIPFQWDYADYASVVLLGGSGIFFVMKAYEYGIEHNDERQKMLRDARADIIRLDNELRELRATIGKEQETEQTPGGGERGP